jgi:hypothetical protein
VLTPSRFKNSSVDFAGAALASIGAITLVKSNRPPNRIIVERNSARVVDTILTRTPQKAEDHDDNGGVEA